MHPRIFRLAAMSLTTAALALGTSITPVQAQPADRGQPDAWSPGHGTVSAITDQLARQLASPLADAVRQDLFAAAVDRPVHLAAVDGSAALEQTVQRADGAVAAAKGLPANAASLIQIRLAHPDMRAAYSRGEAPLIAAAPTDDTVAAVTAYGRNGTKVLLDATRVPQRPVFVVEVDGEKAVSLGLKVMRATLDERGISSARSGVTAQAGYWANKVNAIRLNDDKEPWVKGGAEIFGIAGGFGLDSKVKIDTVTMPYLDNDGTTYYPNQVIVHYGFYKYNFADYVMYEDDGDTNYRNLALAIASALLYIVDGGAYQPLVNAIINAMPDSWWTDDPDYTDSWYTLATTTSGRRYGAANNGWMDIAPYWIEQF